MCEPGYHQKAILNFLKEFVNLSLKSYFDIFCKICFFSHKAPLFCTICKRVFFKATCVMVTRIWKCLSYYYYYYCYYYYYYYYHHHHNHWSIYCLQFKKVVTINKWIKVIPYGILYSTWWEKNWNFSPL